MKTPNNLSGFCTLNIFTFSFSDEYDGGQDAAAAVPQKVNRRIDPLDMTFLNHEAAFKSKSTLHIVRGLIVYQLCSIGFLVENNEKVPSHKF